MPASLLGDMDMGLHHHSTAGNGTGSAGVIGAGLEDQKALRLALELSMLSFGSNPNDIQQHHQLHNNQHHHHSNHHQLVQHFNDHMLNNSGNNGHHGVSDSPYTSAFSLDSSQEDMRILPAKRSQNMTECVPVPSSEHVAEIVGRQGCKIKALRAKTNTYIKTPVRGEEPVFVVTGRKEDVALAKREILSAAEHFSQIRASRKGGATGTNGLTCAPTPVPGQVTIQVTVPYRVVGLVVGPKGATIKRIQQQTHTYIVTPSREKDPVFEVTGLPDNVQQAKREIEAHIAFRTGSLQIGEQLPEDFGLGQNGLLESIYKGGIEGFPFDSFGSLNLGCLEELGLDLHNLGGIGLGTINSLSSSLSSVSGLSHGGGAFENGGSSGKTGSVGSSTNGGGSWSSLSDLTTGFSSASMANHNLLPAVSVATATTTSTAANGWPQFD